jgi:hypothetical protein
MKDARGHGSNSSGRADLPHNKIALASGAHFSPTRAQLAASMTTNDHVAALRARLNPPKQGLLHSFMQGVKDAIGAGKN